MQANLRFIEDYEYYKIFPVETLFILHTVCVVKNRRAKISIKFSKRVKKTFKIHLKYEFIHIELKKYNVHLFPN